MTKEQAERKMCPFMKRTKHNTDLDICCRSTGCMAWGYKMRHAGGNIVEDSGYCKKLT